MAKSSKEFLANIAALAETLRRQIDAGDDGWDLAPEAIAERRRRVLDEVQGYRFFRETYFPHYGTAEPGAMHRYLFERLPEIGRSPAGQRDAIAAPRGESKSVLVSVVFVLWCLITERKHYPMIGSDAFPQAAVQLEAVKAELAFNPRLASDFPDKVGRGRVWQVGVILTADERKVEAIGLDQRILGRRHGPYRPDLIVLDDIENADNVLSLAQRDKLERKVKADVLSLGPPDDSMDVLMVGSVKHPNAVLRRFLRNPLWRGKVFGSILRWPDRMDLWDRFEQLLLTAENPDAGVAAATAMYHANRRAMDAGAIVCWPAMRPLAALMIKRAREGHAAFDSEQQNDPVSGEYAPFADCITYWTERNPRWVFYGACDPSLGRSNVSGDPSAIIVGGFDRDTGILDVLHADIRRRAPHRIIAHVIEAHATFGCLVWGFEAVQFQEFARQELVKQSAAAGMPVPARGLTPIADKDLRIESLQPHMANGLIRLHSSQTTLIEQLRHYPDADHKDGPDALQMLWMLAITGGVAAGAQVKDTRARSADYFERAARQAVRMFARRR